MKLRHPLHEFMPYGAPDLLVAHRPDLSRALTLAAFAVFSLFAGLAALSTLAPQHVEQRPPIIVLQPPPFVPPAIRSLPPSGPPKARVNPAPKFAMPKAVAEEIPEKPVLPPGYDEFAKQVQTNNSHWTQNSSVDTSTRFTQAEDPDKPASYVEVWPVAITEVKPEYPQIARDAMVDGPVFVLVLVGRDGHVREAKIDEHHHVLLLDDAALAAAKKWVFSPAMVGNHPVAVWTAIPFKFILQ